MRVCRGSCLRRPDRSTSVTFSSHLCAPRLTTGHVSRRRGLKGQVLVGSQAAHRLLSDGGGWLSETDRTEPDMAATATVRTAARRILVVASATVDTQPLSDVL